MPHLLLIRRRRQTLTSDNLTERLECLLTGFLAERRPQVFQQNPLMLQKGGAPLSLRMGHLLKSPNGIAEPIRRAAAGQKVKLWGTRSIVDCAHDHVCRDCFVCWYQSTTKEDKLDSLVGAAQG
jgi:hypothetical protein